MRWSRRRAWWVNRDADALVASHVCAAAAGQEAWRAAPDSARARAVRSSGGPGMVVCTVLRHVRHVATDSAASSCLRMSPQRSRCHHHRLPPPPASASTAAALSSAAACCAAA